MEKDDPLLTAMFEMCNRKIPSMTDSASGLSRIFPACCAKDVMTSSRRAIAGRWRKA